MTKRFLVIDDDTDDRELFCEALATVDPVIICHQAPDGLEAFKYLRSKEADPDIIFLDINMPVMNGWEFLSMLKGQDDHKHIPVIVYTTSSTKKDRLIADELGALCFVTKPHAFKRLKVMLDLVVGHVKEKTLAQLCKDLQALSSVPN
jgi:CheY-like chemotaxis protein